MFDLKSVKNGDLLVKAFLANEIAELVEFLNLGKNMNDTQIAGTVEFILESYSNLNMADFKLFFKGIKMGQGGTLYDRIDGQVILRLLSEYKIERSHCAETMQIVQQGQHKQAERLETTESYSQGYIDAIKEILKEVEAKKKAFKEDPKPISKPDQFRTLHNRWMKQFNNLYRGTKFRRYRVEYTMQQFIKVGTLKPMSVNEFLLYKSR